MSMDAQKKLEEQNLQQEQRLKEKEEALAKAEEIIASKDKVILDALSGQISASADGARLLADVTKETEVQSHFSSVLRSAEESIRDLQEALDKKDQLLKTYDQKMAQAIQVTISVSLHSHHGNRKDSCLVLQERESMIRAHQEEFRNMQEQLHSQARQSLDLHKQIVKVRPDPGGAVSSQRASPCRLISPVPSFPSRNLRRLVRLRRA